MKMDSLITRSHKRFTINILGDRGTQADILVTEIDRVRAEMGARRLFEWRYGEKASYFTASIVSEEDVK